MSVMQEDDGAREVERWEGYVDWRNRQAVKGRHGGMVAASFVLGKQIQLPARFLSRFFQNRLG